MAASGTTTDPQLFKREDLPIDIQLLDLLEYCNAHGEPIQPIGAYDIYNIIKREVAPLFWNSPSEEAARQCLERGFAETLLRAYLAVLDTSSSVCPLKTPHALKAIPTGDTRPVQLPIIDLWSYVCAFMQGLSELSTSELSKICKVYLWSAVRLDKRGAPKVRVSRAIVVRPSHVEVLSHRISELSPRSIRELQPRSIRDGYDHMLQTLQQMTAGPIRVYCPIIPLVTYRCTQDVHGLHARLPLVRAEMPNPWLTADCHKQVLCILTFYKLFTIRDQVLRDFDEYGWPRDTTARGFNVFHPDLRGTELLYEQCGTRLHMGDREYSREALQGLSTKELSGIFGTDDDLKGIDLRHFLSPRERQDVLQILDFPYTLLSAYLKAWSSAQDSGDQAPLKTLFAAMSSASCINLRFFAIQDQCKSILGIKSLGQVVQAAYQALLEQCPELDDYPLEKAQGCVP